MRAPHLGDVEGQEAGHRGRQQLMQLNVRDELIAQLEQEAAVALAYAPHLRSHKILSLPLSSRSRHPRVSIRELLCRTAYAQRA